MTACIDSVHCGGQHRSVPLASAGKRGLNNALNSTGSHAVLQSALFPSCYSDYVVYHVNDLGESKPPAVCKLLIIHEKR